MEDEGKPRFKFTNPFKKKTEKQNPTSPEHSKKTEQARELQNYVLEAFSDFEENPANTVRALTNPELLKRFDLDLVEHDVAHQMIFDINKEYTPDEIQSFASHITLSSQFAPETDSVRQALLVPVDFNNPDPDADNMDRVPNNLLKEVGLVYGEELLHFVQKYNGPIAGDQNDEIDVAKFYRDNNISMSDAFLGRHGRREALEKSKK